MPTCLLRVPLKQGKEPRACFQQRKTHRVSTGIPGSAIVPIPVGPDVHLLGVSVDGNELNFSVPDGFDNTTAAWENREVGLIKSPAEGVLWGAKLVGSAVVDGVVYDVFLGGHTWDIGWEVSLGEVPKFRALLGGIGRCPDLDLDDDTMHTIIREEVARILGLDITYGVTFAPHTKSSEWLGYWVWRFDSAAMHSDVLIPDHLALNPQEALAWAIRTVEPILDEVAVKEDDVEEDDEEDDLDEEEEDDEEDVEEDDEEEDDEEDEEDDEEDVPEAAASPTPEIVERIRSLLRLAKEGAGNECINAARRAEELIRKHAVDLAALTPAEVKVIDPLTKLNFRVGRHTWHMHLAWAIAEHCRVAAYRGREMGEWECSDELDDYGHRLRMTMARGYGRLSDLTVWKCLYDAAIYQIFSAAKKAIRVGGFSESESDYQYRVDWWTQVEQCVPEAYRKKQPVRHTYGESDVRAARMTFRESAVRGLSARLHAIRTQAEVADPAYATLVRSRLDEAKHFASPFVGKTPYSGSGTGRHNKEGHALGARIGEVLVQSTALVRLMPA